MSNSFLICIVHLFLFQPRSFLLPLLVDDLRFASDAARRADSSIWDRRSTAEFSHVGSPSRS